MTKKSLVLFAMVAAIFTFCILTAGCGNKYTVTFETDGGSAVKAVTVNAGDGIDNYEIPTKEGCVFAGWYESLLAAGSAVIFPYIPAYDVTLYAMWVDKAALSDFVYAADSFGITIIGYTGTKTAVVIPYGVSSIGASAFRNCGLTSIAISDTVTSIGSGAFSGCGNLTGITMGDGLTSIGDNAFRDCVSLAAVAVPDSVTSIGGSAFYACGSLSTVTIGNGVISIGSFAFYGTAYYKNPANWKSDVLYIGKYIIKAEKEKLTGDFSALYGTRVIADEAFGFCGMKSAVITETVISIGSCAFENCGSLATVLIGESVKSIGNYAFNNCDSLKTIYIDSAAIAAGITSGESCGNLAQYARNIYVRTDIITVGSYIIDNFRKQNAAETAEGAEYYVYSR